MLDVVLTPRQARELMQKKSVHVTIGGMDITLATATYTHYTEHPHYRAALAQVQAWLDDGTIESRQASMNQAARCVGVSSPVVLHWRNKGYLTDCGTDKNRHLVDLVDVVYCKRVMDERGGRSGAPLLDAARLPYMAKRGKE